MDENNEDVAQSIFSGQSVDEYIKDLMTHMQSCQKAGQELAGIQHYQDYVGVRQAIHRFNRQMLVLVESLFASDDIKMKLVGLKLQNQFEMIQEGNDALLEKVHLNIDEASGTKKKIEPDIDVSLRKIQGPTRKSSASDVVLVTSKRTQKPQLLFTEKVDNSAQPFIPLINEKPHSMKPLIHHMCVDEDENEYIPHPYEYEIKHWTVPEPQLQLATPHKPRPMQETPLMMVDSEPALDLMMEELRPFSAIAVDVENHSYRSYLGLTCLIQISTRDKDYVIDPLTLRGRLAILNEIFANPSVLKVFHGACFDVLWLQRCCGIYVVNMFDTHQAAIVLEYPHRSLAALIAKHCGIETSKAYQRADWRIRPLPQDFIDYARVDTHYLLYIYDILRNELIVKGNEINNLINAVYSRSTELCLQRFEKPYINENSHLNLYRKSRKHFNSRQMFALKALYLWTDKTAREQDESTEYILPKHMLLQIAEVLPKEMQGILACCNPIPSFVKSEVLTLHNIIRAAREQSLSRIDSNPQPIIEQTLLNMDDVSTLHDICHDFSHADDTTSGLPTLLSPQESIFGNLFNNNKVMSIILKKKSVLFGQRKEALNHCKKSKVKLHASFISPYKRLVRYLEMRPALELAQKRKDDDRMNRLKDHFLNLCSSSSAESSYEDRINKIKNHFLLLTRNTKDMKDSEDDRVSKIKEFIGLHARRDSMNPEDSRSAGGASDQTREDETVEGEEDERQETPRLIIEDEVRKAQRGETTDGAEHSGNDFKDKLSPQLADPKQNGSAGLLQQQDKASDPEYASKDKEATKPVVVKPFDYSAADYSIFKPARTKFKKQRIEEGFQKRISKKGESVRGRVKSSMKSFSWGNKKTSPY